MLNDSLPEKFKVAILKCKEKLQKYYRKTSLLSMAACILDPRFKLNPFICDKDDFNINVQIDK